MDSLSYLPSREPRDSDRVRCSSSPRPHQERNAFELGVLATKILPSPYKDRIEIVTAGPQWAESDYGLDGRGTNKLDGSNREVSSRSTRSAIWRAAVTAAAVRAGDRRCT